VIPFRWTHQKRLAATYLGLGYTDQRVQKALAIGPETLKRWREFPEFTELVENLADQHHDAMAGLLADGERMAVTTMIELLNSPNDKVRMQAAESLLNRAGKRGKPVEKQEVQSVEFKGDVSEALNRALRDPGVLERLAGAGLLALPSGAEGAARSVSPIPEADYEVVGEGDQGPALGVGGGDDRAGHAGLPGVGGDRSGDRP